MKLPFAQIDAFADRPFTGNPAAVMPLDAWLADDLLQRIAEENNLAETAFFLPDASGEADYELRWFTPAVEVALCGHATLASGHFVLGADSTKERVTFRTRKSGVLEVRRDGEGYAMALPAYPPEPAPNADLLRALGIDAGETLNIVTAPSRDTDVISRVFAPAAGIDEDPVTGSAHSVLTPYWAKRLGRESFNAYQASKRGGHVACTLAGDRAILGGKCVTVIEGEFTL